MGSHLSRCATDRNDWSQAPAQYVDFPILNCLWNNISSPRFDYSIVESVGRTDCSNIQKAIEMGCF